MKRRVAAVILFFVLVGTCSPTMAQSHAVHPFIRPNVATAPPTQSKTAPLYALSSGILWAGVATDAWTTDRAIRSGQFQEGNPLLRRENGTLNKPVFFALGAINNVLTYRLYRHGHPKLAIVLNCIAAGIHFWAAGLNTRNFHNRAPVR